VTYLVLSTSHGAIAVVTPDQSPSLHAAFCQWQAMPERSLGEKLAWDRLLELASDFTEDDIEDVELRRFEDSRKGVNNGRDLG
jgi:hypothetical protein